MFRVTLAALAGLLDARTFVPRHRHNHHLKAVDAFAHRRW
jgi:hypothetical protein